MKPESTAYPVLFYGTKRTRGDSLYAAARKEIFAATGQMPRVIHTEPDISDFFATNPDAELYIPVFVDSVGWWGGLLGNEDVKVTGKIILSADCHLMVIGKSSRAQSLGAHKRDGSRLFTAEIHPSSSFFKKMNTGVALSLDMLATDAGTILGLFSGRNKKKFISLVEGTGNSYLGCIGGY
ncbi:MAG: hypothetical protein FWE17_02065 [Alphaproteobacteria bacterium]|nr:hypothetical protein [Alphaproteobacteria bacterium]MCL2757880.1 hypothetical protein [Alphaproteobacteria bacterium]